MVKFLVPKSQTTASSVGLLLLRLPVGIAMCIHGWGKVQTPTSWMDKMPDPASGSLQALAALSEFGGGIALAAGLLTPLAAVAIACTMGYAVFFYHMAAGHSFVGASGQPSYELALAYCTAAVCVLLCGPGKMSVDAVMFKPK